MRFDETEDPELQGRDPFSRSLGDFDPLTDPWSADAPAAFASADDFLYSFDPVPAEETSFVRYDSATTAYPDRFQPDYRERMTDLQRRLREETITIPRPERRWVVTIRELAETLLLAALIFLAVRASFQNFRVEGASMQPSLEDGEYLIVNKLSYAEFDLGALDWVPFLNVGDNPVKQLWDEPSRGDVIVFRAPTSTTRDFIKRVIGTPGDRVVISQGTGQVFVNGDLLDETYIQGTTSCGETCEYIIPDAGSPEAQAECGSDECFFVMGDNRQNSSDSRQGWMVPRENIIGKALITYWHEGGPKIGLAPNDSSPDSGAAADEPDATEPPGE